MISCATSALFVVLPVYNEERQSPGSPPPADGDHVRHDQPQGDADPRRATSRDRHGQTLPREETFVVGLISCAGCRQTGVIVEHAAHGAGRTN